MSSSAGEQCRSPVGLDCCNCCLDLVGAGGGENNNPGSPTASGFRQLREQLEGENLNAAKLSSIMRQDSLEPVVRDPCYLLNQGICNRNIDQTLLSILLLFHRTPWRAGGGVRQPCSPEPDHGRGLPSPPSPAARRGYARAEGGGEEAGRPRVVLRPGVVLLSGCCSLPFLLCFFFAFFFSLSLFCSEPISVPRPTTRCFCALWVSFRSPFRFAPRFFTLRTFRLFRFVRPFPLCTPLLILRISFCTLFQSVPPSCTFLGFSHPFPSAHPFSLPHTEPHTPQPPQTRGPPFSPHPKPFSTPRSGAQHGSGEERWAHGGARAISEQLAGSAQHYRERRCGAGGGPHPLPVSPPAAHISQGVSRALQCAPDRQLLATIRAAMSTGVYHSPMEVAVYQLHNFSISFFSSLLGGDVVSVKLDNSASGASVVAIDNKIEQAMDLVKNHLMYAVREEVEVLKEQIKELLEKNSQLERENSLLKTLASPEQLEKFQSRLPSEVLQPQEQSPEPAPPAQHSGGSAV